MQGERTIRSEYLAEALFPNEKALLRKFHDPSTGQYYGLQMLK